MPSLEQGRAHWSLQPLRMGATPLADMHPVDAFVRERLIVQGLEPAPRAEARTLVRRVYFDLIGLPPTYDEMERGAQMPLHRLVDQLLADPRYGQRWARHWLDVMRYADTIEQSVDGERRIPFAHTYRDYVVDALNSDKPFDVFAIEQIAADRLPNASPADLRALGMHGVGRQFRSNADGPVLRVDDRVDVVTRGFLGLTVSCARCHDHKFDAVPTADYYSLFGILDSMEEPLDLPAVGRGGDATYEGKRRQAIADYEAHVDACVVSCTQHLKDFTTEYLQYLVRASPNHRTTTGDIPLDTPRGWLVYHAPDRWAALLDQCKARDELFFRSWHELMALPKEGFAAAASRHVSAHPLAATALKKSPPKTMLEVATIYGELIKTGDATIRELVFGKGSPVPPRDRDEVREDLKRFLNEKQLVNRSDGEKEGKLATAITALEAAGPVDRAMIVRAKSSPTAPRILVRGDMKQPGAMVPRRLPQLLSMVDERAYADDGRLQLAQAIASPRNPLTARVIVNRVWQHHFGTGLVATADDFGIHGEAPSHPELLDHLASWFIAHGWSLKALHRYLLASQTWQQSGAVSARAEQVDPGNRWLWRMPPRRLEFEPMRDALLHVAQRLDMSFGRRGALLSDTNTRRSLYGYTDRYRIPALLRNFDVANPDTSIARRSVTMVPLQALFLMNSSFVQQQADAVATKAHSVDDVFKAVLSRSPTPAERALRYQGSLAALAHALMQCNEFIFID